MFEIPEHMDCYLVMRNSRLLHELALLNREGNIRSGVGKKIQFATSFLYSMPFSIKVAFIMFQFEINPCFE